MVPEYAVGVKRVHWLPLGTLLYGFATIVIVAVTHATMNSEKEQKVPFISSTCACFCVVAGLARSRAQPCAHVHLSDSLRYA